jgi:hypothetical protein
LFVNFKENANSPYASVTQHVNKMKKGKSLNLIIEFLKKEVTRLNDEIKFDRENSIEKIELKSQAIAAIRNLEFCAKHRLSGAQLEVITIPENGSDSYFTEYVIVDERGGLENIAEWAVVQNEGKEIRLNCFDLILRKRD